MKRLNAFPAKGIITQKGFHPCWKALLVDMSSELYMPAVLEISIQKKVINLYKKNLSIRKIGKLLNISHGGALHALQRHNIPRRTKSEATVIGMIGRNVRGKANGNWRGGRSRKAIKFRLLSAGGGSCKMCGIKATLENEVIFDFHHRDPKMKDFDIGANMRGEEALLEIKKCDVLCSNCHRMKHHQKL